MRQQLIAIVAGLLLSVAHSFGDEVCHLKIDTCHWSFDSAQIFVPSSAVALDPEVHVCLPEVSQRGTAKVTPSIMIVIDESGSMAAYDKLGERHKVTLELLKEIYAEVPGARVGLVPFSTRLLFDDRDDEIYERITTNEIFRNNTDWHDSYFPMMPLDSVLPDNETVYEKLSYMLSHTDGRIGEWMTSQTTRTTDRNESGGTNISLAFWAARDAFIKDSLNYPNDFDRQRQFIVFLSDGSASVSDGPLAPYETDYIAGDTIPTTFTVFLKPQAPNQLASMTRNIQTNGYSITNKYSELWSVESEYDTLVYIMKQEILTRVFRAQVTPLSGAISGNVSQTIAGSTFDFDNPNPLEAETTDVSLSFEYLI
ncbi:MAG: hypothetical protein GF401_09915, partial [Chitinivibrionales bacterium]|nr:hypothetical protein [Chitinivibrionales bacterium]